MDELIKALLNLMILGFVIFLAWWTTRFIGARMGAHVRGGALRVLHHVPAGRDRSVMLLEAGGRLYLLGITGQQINLLDAIEDPDQIRRILEGTPGEGENSLGQLIPPSFGELFAKALDKVRVPRAGADSPPEDRGGESGEAARLQEQIERLRRLQQK